MAYSDVFFCFVVIGVGLRVAEGLPMCEKCLDGLKELRVKVLDALKFSTGGSSDTPSICI